MPQLKTDNRINKCMILTFLIIFVSNDTLLFGTNKNRLFFAIHVGVLLAAFVYMVVNTKRVGRNILLFATFLIIAIILTMVVNSDTQYIKYLYSMFMVLLCVLFCAQVRCQEFCESFVKVIYFIALTAVAAFIVCVVIPDTIGYLPSIVNTNGIRYYFYGMGFVSSSWSATIPRMYGIFREPGVFACFLSMALMVQLFFLKELNIKRIIVVAVASVLTFSTAAYILMIVILTMFFVKQLMDSKYRNKRALCFFVVLLLVIIMIFSLIGWKTIENLVFNKLKGENASRDSRFGSVETNVRIFMKNPIFGKGWDYVEGNFENYAVQGVYQGTHNTNTFFKFLAIYGIAPFVGIVFLVFVFFKNKSKSRIWGLILTMVWIAALSNEDLVVNILFYLIPFYALEKRTGMGDVR